MRVLSQNRFLYRAEFFTLANVLLVAYILVNPWLKFAFVRRFTFAEPIFVLAIIILMLQYFVGHRLISRESMPTSKYVLFTSFWIMAILVSGLGVAHSTEYLTEGVGMFYLGLLSILTIILASESEERLNDVLQWVRISVISVVAVGVVGILLYLGTGEYIRFFYSESSKLLATFRASNQLAGFLVLFFPFIWEEVFRRGALVRKLFYGIVLILLVVCIVASGSRSAVAALLFGIGLYAFLYLIRANFKMLLVGGGIAAFGYAVVMFVGDKLGVVHRALSVVSFETIQMGLTDAVRHENWRTGWEIFLQNPIAGFGIGNIQVVNKFEIHNTYLAILAELGILGAIAAALLFGYVFICAVQNMHWSNQLSLNDLFVRSRGVFVGLCMFLVFATQHQMFRSRYYWIVIGLVIATNLVLKAMLRRRDPSPSA